jgi:two-component system LytT family response regulator
MIRAWLIDDEALARKRLRRLLEETGRVEVVGVSADGTDALARLPEIPVDALFLDIEMPGLNGFEVLNRLEAKPPVVFTTAYDRYAVKAFEANGIDYLLKPISPEALDRALERLERNRSADPAQYRALIERLAAAMGKTDRQYPRRVSSKVGDRIQFVDLDKVSHFFAEGKLTYAAAAGKNYVVDNSIVQLEAKLDPSQFLRIHRAYLVNLSAVAEICSWFGGKMVARLNDEARTDLPVARDRVRSLKERLGL